MNSVSDLFLSHLPPIYLSPVLSICHPCDSQAGEDSCWGQKAGRFAAAPPSEQNGNVCLHQGPYPSSLLDAPPVSQASPPTKKIKIIKKEASPEF